jgi:hypothetical protein
MGLHPGAQFGIFASVFGKASVTQLVECHLAKVVVEGSNPFARSIFHPRGA